MTQLESFIVDLNQITSKDLNVGSKAANLGELIQNKFSVPDGYVIKTIAYSRFLQNNNLYHLINNSLTKINYNDIESIEECAKTINNAIEDSPLPPYIINEIKKKHKFLISESVIVRSSATAEDLPTKSFAGQYNSFLNLKTIDQVLEHIKKCYASIWTSRAIAYREENQILHNNVELAVIVQKMIPAKSAGVLFTANPVSFDRSEVLIESNFGLGESIMSGKISPDQYIVKTNKQKEKISYKAINVRIGKKSKIVRPKEFENDSGIEYIEISDDKSMQSSLNNQQIIQLVEIGIQIEKLFNNIPQDIEWVIDADNKIYLLQSRPITSQKSQISVDDTIWSRGYSDDYWNDPVSPLFFDLLGDQLTKVVNIELNSIMGYKKIEDQLLKLYNGHVYFNLKVLKCKVENEIPRFMRNEDILNYFPDGSGPYGKDTIKNLPFHLIKRLVAEIRIMLYDPDGSIKKTAAKYENWTNDIFLPFCQDFNSRFHKLEGSNNGQELFNLAEELDRIMVAHFRLVRYGIPVHNIGMNLLSQYILTRFLGKGDALKFFPILISGLENKLTETNNKIHHLVSIIQRNEGIRSIILQKNSEEIYKYLLMEKNQEVQEFLKEFKRFIEDYGDRGFTREPFYARWSEQPMTKVFDILKSLVIKEKQVKKKVRFESAKNREKIKKFVEVKIRSQRFGFLKWKLFSIILNLSRTYISFRENQRFNLDKWITRNRKVYLEIGKYLTNQDKLQNHSDIIFLRKREVKHLILEEIKEDKINNLMIFVKSRKEDFLKYEHTIPSKFLLGSREFNDKPRFTRDSVIFHGIPASQGTITGIVRVLNKIEQISDVQASEILVVPRTDPGWTPIFSKIGGLITETGGILSHGAVVSREYGIAAVTNIPNACKLFKTGQVITINGYDGVVTIKK
ncbi:MAG: hypothetical protein KAT66_02415 [Candidatus Lokiarchaeota archaeon]|nr:hypothetical protein [Candidatus Lokiarchaeota archaeon]